LDLRRGGNSCSWEGMGAERELQEVAGRIFITTHPGSVDAGDKEAQARPDDEDDDNQATKTTSGTSHIGTKKETNY
jgi:hypothetical protein